MTTRNSFASARAMLEILDTLVRGEDWTIRQVADEYDVGLAQAREYLKTIEELYDLDTYRDGRMKVWTWPLEDGVFCEENK